MRLTKRNADGIACSAKPFEISTFDMVDKLAAYEDAEEQGRLVVLPCKVGDTVWGRDGAPWTVISIEWFSRRVTQLHCKSPATGRGMTFSVGKRSLGKTVFLTREEAEAALKRVQDEKNKRWCIWQDEDTIGVYCTAHIHEDRVLNCPYKNLEERQRADYPCQDYRPMKGVRKDGP